MPMPPATTLTIASCNLHNLHENSHPDKIAHLIKAITEDLQLPDIIALQEIGSQTLNIEGEAIAIVADIIIDAIKTSTQTTYRYIDIPPRQNSSGGAQDLNIRPAFLVKDHITICNYHNHIGDVSAFEGNLECTYRPSRKPLLLTAMTDLGPLTLINCHLKSQMMPTKQEKRIAKRQRNEQASAIRSFYEKNNKHPIIVLGDFNDTPNSDTLKILTGERLISMWQSYNGKLYTTHYKQCPIVLDYILIPKTISYQNPQVHHLNTNLKYPYRFSDHDPITIEITALQTGNSE
ncbi:endonuclease/exonuclease/phosphatase family protein [Ignatzschineria larvae DSM 13226]|uniref:Endonuclease/exonuclease/phosphatase family protein n=1 Tax=Ignatzschineria larvae DSM 13226 TaxID=1111732 RepID=A0ABZ3C070_9GAMM|nr:endonuclease/exonuclease/phosphatase family protein [Ignatzschineria larvae]